MVGKVLEDKHQLLWNCVLQLAEIGTARQTAVDMQVVIEFRLRDLLQYKRLLPSAGLPEVRKVDCNGRVSLRSTYVAR